MWGVGASLGPFVMGYALTAGHGWNRGYSTIAILQLVMTAILAVSLPLWKKRPDTVGSCVGAAAPEKALSIRQVLAIPGAKEIMISFFCYCGLEMTAGLWGSSYLALRNGVDGEVAARYASMFFLGITAGRAINGFITMLLSDAALVRIGQGVIVLGLCAFFFPPEYGMAQVGLVLTGLGNAPIYPCIIHSTPEHFGEDKSQALIGIQMASAYTGSCLLPPLFGLIAEYINIALFPVYLLVILILMFITHENMLVKTKKEASRV
jgi:fucose permease